MHEADLVANTVKIWVGNPILKSLLKWVQKEQKKAEFMVYYFVPAHSHTGALRRHIEGFNFPKPQTGLEGLTSNIKKKLIHLCLVKPFWKACSKWLWPWNFQTS